MAISSNDALRARRASARPTAPCWAEAAGARIEQEIALLGAPGESGKQVRFLANVRADTAVFVLSAER